MPHLFYYLDYTVSVFVVHEARVLLVDHKQLKRWLPCIQARTLVLWGASDRIVTADYGKVYADLIPGARFEALAAAGHHPEIEQPAALAERVIAFMQQ